MQTAYWPDRLDFDQSNPSRFPRGCGRGRVLVHCPSPGTTGAQAVCVCLCAKFKQLCCFSKILTRKVCAITKQITSSILQNNRNLRSFKSFLPSQQPSSLANVPKNTEVDVPPAIRQFPHGQDLQAARITQKKG